MFMCLSLQFGGWGKVIYVFVLCLQIRKMDLEARSLQPSIKAGLLAKLREYKSDLNNVKSELKRISAPNARQATREELLESGMADTLAVS
jgi:vesicle transport through interaction with t-SNAREs 1